ncbi:hypothetical protein [Blastococcus sp. CCUG 61487]|uniref:hypothetical protein n=1 Tax=Blastococcus sp. CCUG 61487 TaxID=1840703 RepID=UPI0010C0DDBB|nr:hypothetical protein [Blastococcus sp. CCUG 61487]TKJ25212.1 hypothetical protein A6V29_04105 [Blastococcus sp. CCUG 61487]
MSLRDDGHYHCDKCGLDLGNGRAQIATKVAGRHPDEPLRQRQLDFCVEERPGAPFGCTGLIIGPAAVADLTTYQETRNIA